jgi:prophage regulatory protein
MLCQIPGVAAKDRGINMKKSDRSEIDTAGNVVLVRLRYIVGPTGVLPISRSTFYAGIKAGRYPPPKRLGPRVSVWSKSEIDDLCRQLSGS